MPVELLDLTAAYGALADDGILREPRWTEGPADPGRQLFSAEHARLIGKWLSDPVARMPGFPRAGHAELPFAVALKTGTSPDYRDSWAVGWSDRYVVGVWIGHPDWRPMKGLSGYRGGAKVLSEVFEHLHADELDGLANTGLPEPEGWSTATVCSLTGQLAGPPV